MSWVLEKAIQGIDKHGHDVVVGTIVKLDADGFAVDEQGRPYDQRTLRHERSYSPTKADALQTDTQWLANADREFTAMIAYLNVEEEAIA